MDNRDFMTGYELRAVTGKKKSKADLLKDSKMFQNALRDALSIETDVRLDSGEIVSIPAVDKIAIGKVAYWIENPEKADFKEIQSVLGENKVEQEITVRGADALFGDLVIKEEN